MKDNKTPYHKRLAARLAKSKEQHSKERDNRYMQIDRFLCTFEKAWKDFYQDEVTVTYKHGWYYLQKQRLRHSDLEKILFSLFLQLQEIESPSPEEKNND